MRNGIRKVHAFAKRIGPRHGIAVYHGPGSRKRRYPLRSSPGTVFQRHRRNPHTSSAVGKLRFARRTLLVNAHLVRVAQTFDAPRGFAQRSVDVLPRFAFICGIIAVMDRTDVRSKSSSTLTKVKRLTGKCSFFNQFNHRYSCSFKKLYQGRGDTKVAPGPCQHH